MKIRNHFDRVRVSVDCGGPSPVDQSQREVTDVNRIAARAKRAGQWPAPPPGRVPFYGDVASVPTDLLAAYEAVDLANQAFMSLPSDLRKGLKNDPSRLAEWLSKDENYDDAVRYGLLDDDRVKARLEARDKQKAASEGNPPP